MTDRTQPPRLKGLQWYDQKPSSRAETLLMVAGMTVAATGILVLIGAFF